VAKALIAKFGSFAAVLAGDRAALTEAGLNLPPSPRCAKPGYG
jgi:hypothetical protein